MTPEIAYSETIQWSLMQGTKFNSISSLIFVLIFFSKSAILVEFRLFLATYTLSKFKHNTSNIEIIYSDPMYRDAFVVKTSAQR